MVAKTAFKKKNQPSNGYLGRLIEAGQEGTITYQVLNELIPDEEKDLEKLEEIFDLLCFNNIEVIDGPEFPTISRELFRNKIDTDALPILVIDVNKELKRYLAKHPQKLYDLSPRKFEELVADILKDFGFDVSLTPSTRDGGKDILAYMRNQICSYLMFVECKRWKPEQHVGIEIVQRLYGVQQANNANKSMVVTTSFFSKSAIEESKRYEYMMALKDYDDLTSWLKRYA